MSLHQNIVVEPCSGVRVSAAPNGLADIGDVSCSAAIWERTPLPNFQDWIDKLEPVNLPRAHLVMRSEAERDAMSELVEAYSLPASRERTFLVDDVAALATLFSSIMDCACVRLRLDVIETNACRNFHMDALTARLICTYRGHATQYGNGDMGDDPAEIHAVPTGSPMIMRGSLWPSSAEQGLLHRSPPIEGTGESRFVLVLDPMADGEVYDEAY